MSIKNSEVTDLSRDLIRTYKKIPLTTMHLHFRCFFFNDIDCSLKLLKDDIVNHCFI